MIETNPPDEFNNTEIWDEQVVSGDLKEAINLFIWRWGHPQLTLVQAEKIAIEIFDMLSKGQGKNER